jgi:4-hydroxybenzoate polyprenyltransferase
MNIAYCLKLKQYAILDVTIIAIGFVMRVLIGGQATDIWISQWLVLMTFLLALFLALAKRSDDFSIFVQTGVKPRVSITGYNKEFINGATAIVASVTVVCYIMYTMSNEVIQRIGSQYLYLTSSWVLIGLLRYLQKTIVYESSGSPTKSLMEDRFIQFCVIGWILSFFAIIYL